MVTIIKSFHLYYTASSKASALTPTSKQLNPVSILGEVSATSIEVSIRQLDQKFNWIERQVFKTIKQCKVSLDQILDWIKFPPIAIRPLFADLARELSKIPPSELSIDRLSFILPHYWNSFHPSILEHFVNELKVKRLQEQMQQYLEKLHHFCKETSLGDFLDKWVGNVPTEYHEFDVHLEEKWRDKTVADVIQFQGQFSRLISIKGAGIMSFMKAAKSSSVLVVFALPQHLFPLDFRQKALHDFLRSEDVIKVIVDGQCVLDFKQLVSCLYRLAIVWHNKISNNCVINIYIMCVT